MPDETIEGQGFDVEPETLGEIEEPNAAKILATYETTQETVVTDTVEHFLPQQIETEMP
jgi:hypothetical protein